MRARARERERERERELVEWLHGFSSAPGRKHGWTRNGCTLVSSSSRAASPTPAANRIVHGALSSAERGDWRGRAPVAINAGSTGIAALTESGGSTSKPSRAAPPPLQCHVVVRVVDRTAAHRRAVLYLVFRSWRVGRANMDLGVRRSERARGPLARAAREKTARAPPRTDAVQARARKMTGCL